MIILKNYKSITVFLVVVLCFLCFCATESQNEDNLLQPKYFLQPPYGPTTTFSDLIQKFSHFFKNDKKLAQSGGANVLSSDGPKNPEEMYFFETAQLPQPKSNFGRESIEFEQTAIGIDLGGQYVNGRVFKFKNAFKHLKIIPPVTGCQGSAQPATVDETISAFQQQISAKRTTNFFSSFIDTLLPKLPAKERMSLVEKTVQTFFPHPETDIFGFESQNSFFPLTTTPFCKLATNSGFFVKRNGKCLGNIVSDSKILQWDGKMNVNFGITESGQVVVGYLHDSQIENFPDFEERRKNFSAKQSDSKPLPSFKFSQLFQGVIWLVRKGEVFVDQATKIEDLSFQETGTPMEFVTTRASRMSMCVNKRNEILLAVFDGDGNHLKGPTLPELAEFMKKELDCVEAANLDGGGSTTIVENDKILTSFVSDNCKNSQINVAEPGKPWERCRRGVGTVMCFHDYHPLEDPEVLSNKEIFANVSANSQPFRFEELLKLTILPKKEEESQYFLKEIEKLKENSRILDENNKIIRESYESFKRNTFSFEFGQNILLFFSIFANLAFVVCAILLVFGYCSCSCFGKLFGNTKDKKILKSPDIDEGPELELNIKIPNEDDDELEDEDTEKGSLLTQQTPKSNEKDEESAIN